MTDAVRKTGGLGNYIATAAEVGGQLAVNRYLVLLRMLCAKALYGLSAAEYGLYGLQRRPFFRVSAYRNKKQTTAWFNRINPGERKPLVEDKLVFHRKCQSAGLPVPRLLAVLSSRSPRDIGDFPLLTQFSEVQRHVEAHESVRLILKPRNDALGTGVRFVEFRSGEPFDIEGRPIGVAAFADALHFDMRRDDYLVQSFVRPHPDIARLGSGKALGTLRIVTFLKGGQFWILYALLRIPSGGNVHDNFSGGASGNLIANVDVENGRLGPAWGRRNPKVSRLLESFDRNPDTGLPVRGEVVPRWGEIRDAVRHASEEFHELPFLGWDFALSEDGIVIIEANSNPDIIGAQVSTGKGARELLRPLCAA